VITVPGRVTVALRALSLMPARLREAMHNTLLPGAESIGDEADEATIVRKSATGGTGD